MPLAGKVKLKTFMAVAGTGLVALVAGSFFGIRSLTKSVQTGLTREASQAAPAQVEPTADAPQPLLVADPQPAQAEPAQPRTGRELDAAVFSYRGKNLGADKKKDVTKGRAYKVNVYMDAGHTVANRAKVDLDRDDKWDEKFTFDGDNITRQVAPADDENYTLSYVWDGEDWAPQGQ